MVLRENIGAGGTFVLFTLFSVVSDETARAFIRQVKRRNSYFGCDLCMQLGI